MKRFLVPTAAIVLAPARALAQTPPPPQASGSWVWWAVVAGAILVVATGVLVAVGVRYFEAKNRRESESVRLQSAIAAPLRRNPRLTGLAILPMVTIGPEGDATVELSGDVPSAELHDEVLTVVEHTLDRHRPGTRIIDNLRVTRVA